MTKTLTALTLLATLAAGIAPASAWTTPQPDQSAPLSGTDLGSGRINTVSGLDLGSGR